MIIHGSEKNGEGLIYQRVDSRWVNGKYSIDGRGTGELKIFLAEHCPGRILDWGCRTGLYMDIMSKYKYLCKGLEVLVDYVNAGVKAGRKIVLGDCIKTNKYFRSNYFDYVWSRHLLEHLDYPVVALESLRVVVRLGGLGLFLFPCEKKIYKERHRCLFPDRDSVLNIIGDGWEVVDLKSVGRKADWKLLLRAV